MLVAVCISSYGCTWEVWRALKKLELLSATLRATLRLLSCSPNSPRASLGPYTHAKHEPIPHALDNFFSLSFALSVAPVVTNGPNEWTWCANGKVCTQGEHYRAHSRPQTSREFFQPLITKNVHTGN